MATSLEMTPLKVLRTAEKNPKRHSGEIGTSIGRFGYVEPIVLDERTGRIVAGHGRREALLAMHQRGESPPAGILSDGGEWLVPVLRGWASRSDAEAEAYLLASNKLTEAGGWDEDALAAVIRNLSEQNALEGVGFGDQEIADLLAAASAPVPTVGLTDPDDAPQPVDEPYVKAGDLWLLGGHRLLCGDSTKSEDVLRVMAGERAQLMATDPPYLVDYDGTNHPQSKRSEESGEENNKHWDAYTDPEAAVAFFESFLTVALRDALTERPFVYQWFASMRADLVLADWRNAGLLPHQQLIWTKTRAVLTRCDFMWDYEPCMYGWVKGMRPPTELAPPNNARAVWDIDSNIEDGAKGIHPTMKPVEVIKRPIEYHTKPGWLIYEPFSGSGTAIIAAEMTGRRCNAIELSPQFVQVAVERWQNFTGKRATKETATHEVV